MTDSGLLFGMDSVLLVHQNNGANKQVNAATLFWLQLIVMSEQQEEQPQ